MSILIPKDPDHYRNADRIKPGKNHLPCVVCGRGCDQDSPSTKWLHVCKGGLYAVHDDECEPAGCLGTYPVGQCCLKKHPELKPYVKN